MALIEHIRNGLVDSTGKIREYYLAENINDAWFQQVVGLANELKTVRISINNGSSWTTVATRGNINLCELFYGSGTSKVLPANANVIIEISEYVPPVDYSGNGYYNSASITTGGSTYTPVSNRITVPVNKITKTIADVKGTPETSTITIDFPTHVESISIVYKDKNGQEQTLNMTRAQYDAYIQTYGTQPTLECWSGTSASVTKTYEAGYDSGGSTTTETDWAIGRPSGGTQGGSGKVYYIDDEGHVSNVPENLGDLGDDEPTPEPTNYTATIIAGNYVTDVRVKVNSGSWSSSGGSASNSEAHYGDTIYWEMTDYNTSNYQYDYSGPTSGSFTMPNSNYSLTVNRTRSSLKSYKVKFLSGSYGGWTGADDEITVNADTAISRSGNTVTVGSTSNTYNKPSDTAQYYYTMDWPALPNKVTEPISIRPTVDRYTQKYTITLTSENGYWEQGATTITQINNVPYGTAISKSGTTLTVGSTNYSFNANAATAQYNYTNPQIVAFAGSTVTGDMSIHGKATANLRSYTVTLSSTYGHWINSGGTIVTTAGSRSYGTSMSKNASVMPPTLTVGSDTYTFTAEADTAQYRYTQPKIGTVPSSVTGATTISGSATQTLRSYTVTIYYHFESTPLWSDNRVFDYGTTVYPDLYFADYSDSSYTYTNAAYDNPQEDSGFTVTGDRTVSVHYTNRTFTGTATIYFSNPTYGTWSSYSKTAQAGDYLSVSGNTITCKIGGSSGSARWTNTLTANSPSAEYTYYASISSSSQTVSSSTIYISSTSGREERRYTPIVIYERYLDGQLDESSSRFCWQSFTYNESGTYGAYDFYGDMYWEIENPTEIGDYKPAILNKVSVDTVYNPKAVNSWTGYPAREEYFYVILKYSSPEWDD